MKNIKEKLVLLSKRSWQPIKKFKLQSYGLALLLLILMIVYLPRWRDGENLSDSIWEFVDPVAGIMTFATTLAIFYFQGYQRWEDSLEKRLTISYQTPDEEPGSFKEIIRIEKAYLLGKADIRAWAQSLGKLIMGNFYFDMNWNDPAPEIKFEDSKWFKDYELTIFLTSNPFTTLQGQESYKKFKTFKFHYSETSGDLDNLPIRWCRKELA